MSDFLGSGKGKPTNTDESIQEIVQALTGYLPTATAAQTSQLRPYAQASTDIAKEYSPQIADLMNSLLGNQGKEAAAIGRDISREEQMGAAQTEADILKGPGGEAARSALALQKEYDPEFFANREKLANHLDQAFSALGAPGKVSPGELEQIARGIGRTSSPVASGAQTIENATTFGNAAAAKRAEWNNLLTTQINAANAEKSGLNAPDIAARRTILPNAGLANFTGIQTPGSNLAQSQLSDFMKGLFGIENTTKNKSLSTNEAIQGYTKSIGNLVSAAEGGAAMAGCWIARAAYGETDLRWLDFRYWLEDKAPEWLYRWYYQHGPAVGEWLKDKPLARIIVRGIMNILIKL